MNRFLKGRVPLFRHWRSCLLLVQHSVPANDHPEVVLLPVIQVLLVVLSNHPASAQEHPEVVLLPVVLT